MSKVKFKTLDNWITKQIVQCLKYDDFRSALYLLYNLHDELEFHVFIKTFKLIVSFADNDLDIIRGYIDGCCSCEVRCFVYSTINSLYHEKD